MHQSRAVHLILAGSGLLRKGYLYGIYINIYGVHVGDVQDCHPVVADLD